LVHGAFHGGWCWEKVIPELERLGHTALAIDLPGYGERVNERASLAGYRDPVLEVLEPGDVLVGHSLGGLVITVAADAAANRIRHLVYLATLLPTEGKAWAPISRLGPGLAKVVVAAGGLFTKVLPRSLLPIRVTDNGGRRLELTSEATATASYYHDCSPELAHWAFSKLTPQPLAPTLETISIPRFWKPNSREA
jgi:pimeloyl-ACP methyl ester carboxylesterase